MAVDLLKIKQQTITYFVGDSTYCNCNIIQAMNTAAQFICTMHVLTVLGSCRCPKMAVGPIKRLKSRSQDGDIRVLIPAIFHWCNTTNGLL